MSNDEEAKLEGEEVQETGEATEAPERKELADEDLDDVAGGYEKALRAQLPG